MLELLADLGRQSVSALWLPLAAWSVSALVAEGALRWTRPPAALALPVRGALLAALPLAVAGPMALRFFAPDAVEAVAAAVPTTVWLPEVSVGAPAAAVDIASSGPPLGAILLGLLVVALGVVSALALARFGYGLRTAMRASHLLPSAGPEAHAAVDDARQRLGVARPIDVVEAPPATAPFTVGWRRPLVALPNGLSPEARAVAALHEVAHVHRADFAWHAAQRGIAALFAAHPLVWMLGRGLDLDRERAADAAVLAAQPGSRRAYADLLFSYATLPAPALSMGAASGSSSLKSRIDAMASPLSLDQSRRLGRWGRLAGLAALAVAIAGATLASPSPTVAPTHSVAMDSLVQSVHFRIDDGTPVLSVFLVPGATEADAQTVADEVDSPGDEARAGIIQVAHDGGTLTQEVHIREGRTSLGGVSVSLGGLARTGPRIRSAFDISEEDLVDRIDVVNDRGRLVVDIMMAEEATRADAQRVARRLAAMDRVRRIVARLADGTVVEQEGAARPARRTLDRLRQPTASTEPAGPVEGTVVDADTRAPIAAANLQVVGTEVGAATGTDGRYRLNVPSGAQVVRISAVGYETRTLQLADGQSELDVALTTSNVRPPVTRSPGARAPDVFEVAEVQPTLIGGLRGLQERVTYPQSAREEGIDGQVVIQFVVNEEGRVTDPVVLRSPDDRLSEAALAAVRGSTFEPGRQRGEPVKVRFAVPVTFRLRSDDQGQALPHDRELRRRLPYSGTDLTLLDNEAHVLGTRARMLSVLDDRGAASGTAVVRYTLLPNGRAIDLQMAEDTADGAVGDLARFLVGMMTFKEDRRPPQPYTDAYFRLDYQRPE